MFYTTDSLGQAATFNAGTVYMLSKNPEGEGADNITTPAVEKPFPDQPCGILRNKSMNTKKFPQNHTQGDSLESRSELDADVASATSAGLSYEAEISSDSSASNDDLQLITDNIFTFPEGSLALEKMVAAASTDGSFLAEISSSGDERVLFDDSDEEFEVR